MTHGRLVAALGAVTLLSACSQASAVRFSVIGDWGAGSSAQARIATQMCRDYDRARAGFIATVGDNFYPSGGATSSNWNTPMACLIRRGIPWRAAWGNHDIGGGNGTATALNSPRRWYSLKPANAVRLIFLDSNQPSNPSQLTWLKRVLRAEVGRKRPIIVLFHHPNRTAGTHSPADDQRKLWEPLFVRYGVKLVLQGHNHNYERIQYRKVTYLTTGGGGQGLYPCIRVGSTPGLKVCKPVYEFLSITATPRFIGVRVIDDAGRIVEKFRISPAKG